MESSLRETLRRLVERLPDADLAVAERVLRGLLALDDDWDLGESPVGEPATPDEKEALREADDDLKAGRIHSGDEVKRMLGLG